MSTTIPTLNTPSESSATRRSWQVPRYGVSTTLEVLTWAKQQTQDGQEFLKNSPGYTQMEEAIRILSGRSTDPLEQKQRKGYSRVRTQRAKRNVREMINSLADIRYAPGFHSDANETQNVAALLNRVGASWYVDTFADVKIKKAIQWMGISPCGWLEICYRKLPGKRGKAEIDLIPMSAFDVVMTGVPESGDHQEAYTVTLIKDLPMYQAHALWPDFQNELKPDRETPRGWMDRMREKAAEFIGDVFGVANESATQTARNPTCRIYYQFVLDLSINRTKSPMKMGFQKKRVPDPADPTGKTIEQDTPTPWSYEVPYVGQPLPVGWDEQGNQTYRLAEPEDCRIFPGRRLIVYNEGISKPMYDGPMWDWHGMVPLVKFAADQWPFGAFSMLHDVAPMHDAINEVDRISHQTLRNRFNPSFLYNIKAMTREKAKVLNAEIQGQRVGYNGTEAQGENVVRTLLPTGFNVIEEWVKEWAKYLSDEMDYEMGVRDITALSKLRVGASSDSMEKMMELTGPIVKGISRDMERSMRDLAEMFKYLVLQYYNTPRIMQIVGEDGITPENFDFDPGNMIPSHLPGERAEKPSVYTQQQRAHWLADHVTFFITPNTLHEITQTSQKLMYLQLGRSGLVPIDPWTYAEIFRVGNFGKVPEGTNSILERYFAWEKMKMENQAALSAEAQGLMGGGPGAPPGGQGAPGLGPGGGHKGTGGRAPSAQAAPKAAQKGDGRPYIRESR